MVKPTIIPTRIPFLDEVLGGGQCSVGVHGIFGATGIGKSHTATMIAVQGATGGSVFKKAWRKAKPWLLFDLESIEEVARHRALSFAAFTSRSINASGPGSTDCYEGSHPDEFPHRAGTIIKAADRYGKAFRVLPEKLRLYGYDWFNSCGENRMRVAGKIADEVTRVSAAGPIGGIVIDGMSALCSVDQESYALREHEFMRWFVGEACAELASKHECPVWITFQLNGKANQAMPTKPLTHKDAAGCKTLGSLLKACVVFGTRFDLNDVFSATCTKSPTKSDSPKMVLVKHHTVFASIVKAEAPRGFKKDRLEGVWREVPAVRGLLDMIGNDALETALRAVQEPRRRLKRRR